ncbi:hypothetical protein M378DRAFT_481405 [Amanita muscaria Koide BX008]|uniref:Uncharacterized protein n=1 Tax=Amanita muscaria (strain Koide BX008) TaxID=946122 RepID=A0A0C2XMC5_AMAMK|nr:hypothetical protein M378DRAFT_481405 [Amanita muscaria Koide BX008]
MDSETCSFLFKRWSDDYANCQRLQQELATLRQQHEDLLRQLQTLQLEREQCTRLHSLPAPPPPVQPLNQAVIEAELQRWPEYLNLKEQLQASVEHKQLLTNENNDLRSALQRHEAQATDDTQSISALTERVQELTAANANLGQDCDRITQQYEDVKAKHDELQRIAKMLYDADTKLEERVRIMLTSPRPF